MTRVARDPDVGVTVIDVHVGKIWASGMGALSTRPSPVTRGFFQVKHAASHELACEGMEAPPAWLALRRRKEIRRRSKDRESHPSYARMHAGEAPVRPRTRKTAPLSRRTGKDQSNGQTS